MKGGAVLERLSVGRAFLEPDVLRVVRHGRRREALPVRRHLEAAIRWLSRAQDATGSGGVARGLTLAHTSQRRRGWQPAYPEATGYLIPTMFDYARWSGAQEPFDRAVRMAAWECAIQMESGAVQGGTLGSDPQPAIFNTGQVVFGWVRAWRETGREAFLESAIRAGDFLVERQDADGAWRRNLSRFTSGQMPSATYDTRTAWSLDLLAGATGDRRYADAARANVEHALTQQQSNGYFANNCLSDPHRALLHTIAYALRGIVEVAAPTAEPRYLDSVSRAVEPLARSVRPDGSLAGRFDVAWKPAVAWSCLTGNSQFAIVLGRLHQIRRGGDELRTMRAINAFQRSVQILDSGHPDLDGGLCGSYPVHGAYGRFALLSWPVKFFVDALLLELEIAESRPILMDSYAERLPRGPRGA